MKNKISITLIMLSIFSLSAFTILTDNFTLKFSEAEINNHYQNLSNIKAIVERSNLPHQEVIFVQKSIDSLQNEIVRQLKTQVPPLKK